MSRIMPSLSGGCTWQRTMVQAWPPGISRPGSGRACVHAVYAPRLRTVQPYGPNLFCARAAAPRPMQSWCNCRWGDHAGKNLHDPCIALSVLACR